MMQRAWASLLLGAALLMLGLGAGLGSSGWQGPWATASDPQAHTIVWDLRVPRTLGAWLVGALLGLSGAVAQGLFRNPLAEPFLLGSSGGAGLGVALALAAMSGSAQGSAAELLGLTGAAFVGASGAVVLTLLLSRGAQHTPRLLLAGIVCSVVLGALTQAVLLVAADVLRAMQAFLLGNTALLGWPACAILAPVLLLSGLAAWLNARRLDALMLGEDTALSLGVPLAGTRALLVAVLALAAAAAVAQAGLVAFVGLVAPHLVRGWGLSGHRQSLPASALTGGLLLQAADVASRALMPPQEVPVGLLTAVLGGGYLLWLMHRRAP